MGVAIVFMLSPEYLKNASSNTLVLSSYIVFGYLFLIFAANVYCVALTKKEKFQLFLLGIFQLIVIYLSLQIPFVIRFFDITLPYPTFDFVSRALLVVLACAFVQYFIVKKYFLGK